MRAKFWNKLFVPVDIASTVFFRIAFGAIMLWEVYRYFSKGWIPRYWIRPDFHFTYWGFDWVQPWPGDGMYWHFYALGFLSICIILGLFYRVAATLFFLGFTYVFLLEKANYLNHFYLVALISFLMIFVPANRNFSLDALIWPKLRSDTVPSWVVWLLRFQIGVPYFFGGIAKINYDWLRGEPMRMWLENRSHYAYIGQYFTEEWMVYLLSYGGLLFDLFVVPLLLWKRTRVFAYCFVLFFNLSNHFLFHIGIFPWFMIFGTLIFFEPDWPRRLLFLKKKEHPVSYISKYKPLTATLLTVWFLFQVLMPFRHFLYPGNVHWTEEGHNFSWHMKLRSKRGDVTFYVLEDDEDEPEEVEGYEYLKSRQNRKMSTRPDLILQFAHFLSEEYDGAKVYADAWVSLNGRKKQQMIDPKRDLSQVPRNLWPADWILPFKDNE